MTVKELKSYLNRYNDDANVLFFVDDEWGGYWEKLEISHLDINENENILFIG